MDNETSNFDPNKIGQKKMNDLLMAYKNEKRFLIRKLLRVYGELSLTDLSRLMKMSKTAIHHHLKLMRSADLIEVSREVDSRGSINKKYFCLKKGPQRFNIEDLKNIEPIEKRYDTMKVMMKTLQVTYGEVIYELNLFQSFLNEIEKDINLHQDTQPDISKLDEYQELMETHNIHLRNIFLSKKQFVFYKNLEANFLNKVDELLSNDTDDESPYLVTLMEMPIKNLMEYKIDFS